MNIELQQFLMTEPDGTLETIATQFDTTLLEVVRHLSRSLMVVSNSIQCGIT